MEKRNKAEIIVGEVNKKDPEKFLRWDWFDIGVLGDKKLFEPTKKVISNYNEGRIYNSADLNDR